MLLRQWAEAERMLADEKVCCSQQNKMLAVADNKHAGDAMAVLQSRRRVLGVWGVVRN